MKKSCDFDALLQKVLRVAPLVVWSIDSKGIFTLSEGRGLEKIGLKPRQVIGRSVFKIYKDHKEILKAIRTALKGKEFSLSHEVGPAVYKSRYIPIHNSKKKVTGVLGISVDITKQVYAERDLSNFSRQLMKSNSILKDFAQTASHDLRAPLRNLKSFVSHFMSEYADQVPENGRKYLNFIRQAAERMDDMVKGLLGQAELDRSKDFPSKLFFVEAVDSALSNLKVQVEETKAQIEVHELPELSASKSQMTQVFQNLIGNALKYSGSKKPKIIIDCILDNSEWIVRVKDFGIGIPKKDFDKIFNLYTRLDLARSQPGAGLGLSIVRRIVEYHGGRIWVDSKLKKGSTFFMSFPANL